MVNAYALAFGGLLLLGGRSGDLLGRRRIFIFGILLFTVASLVGGFATTQAWLLTARVAQGVGGAFAAPTSLSLIAVTFPEGRPRNRAMGVYAAMSIAGGAVGLIAGGLLVDYLDWRWVFWVNVPIGLIVALLAPRVLGESERRRGALRPARRDHRVPGPWGALFALRRRPRSATARRSRTGATPRSSCRWWRPWCCWWRSSSSRRGRGPHWCRRGWCGPGTAAGRT